MKHGKKIKSLTLILRSLPPKAQEAIISQLPSELVDKLIELEPTIDEELSNEDWDYFYKSWPELGGMIDSVQTESKQEKINTYMATERTKVREYLEYKYKGRKERPNISNAISKIINQVVAVQ